MQPATQRPVIVVGAGLAGLTAAYSALKAGASSVRLLERAAKHGGNSIKASSGINGAPTRFQSGADTTFFSDTTRSAGMRLAEASPGAREQRESLIKTLTDNSAGAIDFMVGEIGVDLSTVAQLGGHSFARTHRGSGKLTPGFAIVSALMNKLNESEGRFQLLTSCEVTRLLQDDAPNEGAARGIKGVEYVQDGQPHTLLGPVVFATGGFGGDTHGLLAAHRPDLAGMPSTNEARPRAAHGVLAAAGARLVDMASVQVHPTGFVDPAAPENPAKFLAAEMLRGEGAILLRRGRRFVNEMATREHVSAAIMAEQPPAPEPAAPPTEKDGPPSPSLRQWDIQILLDPGACAAADGHVGFYLFKKLLRKVKVGSLDAATRETLREYARIVGGQAADPLGRTAFGNWALGGTELDDDEVEVCLGSVTPVVHFTMGGAVFNDKSQVLCSDLGDEGGPQAIPGLWAAGEVTGGIHGDNRLGGSSLLECVVFGRIAGEQAAASLGGKL